MDCKFCCVDPDKVKSTLKNDGLKIRAEDMPLNGNGQPKDDMGGSVPVLADAELKAIMQQTNTLLTQFSQNPYLSGKAPVYNPVFTTPLQNTPGITKVTLVGPNGEPLDGVVNSQPPPVVPGGGGARDDFSFTILFYMGILYPQKISPT